MTLLSLIGVNCAILKYFPGWMVTPVVLGFGGHNTTVVQQPAPTTPPPVTPPPASSATEATRRLIRDVASQRSYQTTVLTRHRDHLIPGQSEGLPPQDNTGGSEVPGPSGPVGPGTDSPSGPGIIDVPTGTPVGTDLTPNPFIPPPPPVYTPEIPSAPLPSGPTSPPPGSVNVPPTVFHDEPTITPAPVPPTSTNTGGGSVNMPPTVYPGWDDGTTGNPGSTIDSWVNPSNPGNVYMPDTQYPGFENPGSVNMPDTVFYPTPPPPTNYTPGSGPGQPVDDLWWF